MRYEEMKETQAKFESSVGSYIKAHPRESYREVGKAVGISITDRERIKVWVDAGKQVVMVAKFGKCAVLDFDNFEACKELGFDKQWLQGMLRVDTPSGPGYFHVSGTGYGFICHHCGVNSSADSNLPFELGEDSQQASYRGRCRASIAPMARL
jgi:hypothetical protein